MGVASLVLGIIGVFFAINPWLFWLGIVLSVIALVLGVVDRKRAMIEQRPTGSATAGMVLGIVGTSIGCLFFVACASCVKGVSDIGKEASKHVSDRRKTLVPPGAPQARLGEDVVFAGDSSWTVLSARDRGNTMTGSFGKSATTPGRFIEVTYRIRNLTKKSDSILIGPKVIDASGREFDNFDAQDRFVPDGKRTLLAVSLPPSIAREFVAIYELPPDSEGLQFQARPLDPFGSKKTIDLGL